MQLFQSIFHWYLAVTIIAWMSYPLTYRFFKNLPDRGIAFSKTIGLIVTNYIFWLLGSLGFVSNNISGIIFSIFIVIILGIIWLKRSGINSLTYWIKEQKKYIISIEFFFLFMLLGWALVRSFTPNINGTEKPMEFMFLNSILRSPTFPPHDAWLSGHAISYYYFGYIIVASTALITNTTSSIAFNLGIALIFALSATAALGISINLLSSIKPKDPNNKENTIKLTSTFWPSLLAPLIILVMGNYYGPLGIISNNGGLSDFSIPAIRYDFGDQTGTSAFDSTDELDNPPGIKYGVINFWEWLDISIVGFMLGWAIGRMGCLLAGDVIGKPTDFFLGISAQAIDTISRHPVAGYESFASIIIFSILIFIYNARVLKDGLLFFLGFILYFAARFGIDFTREYASVFLGLSVSQIAIIIFFIMKTENA